jgi:hypothetical protein
MAEKAFPPEMGIDTFKEASGRLAALYESQGKRELSEAVRARELAYLAKFLQPSDAEYREAEQSLADLYLKHGKPDRARPLFDAVDRSQGGPARE